MPFLSGAPQLELDPDGTTFTLRADVIYQGSRETFRIPAGFRTDLATIPPVAAWFLPKLGLYSRAAIVHDWLCVQLYLQVTATLVGGTFVRAPATPIETDGIFRRLAREAGVDVCTRWLLWTGVRWGALGSPYRRAGWARSALPVLAISILVAPVVLPASLLALCGIGALRCVSALVSAVKKITRWGG